MINSHENIFNFTNNFCCCLVIKSCLTLCNPWTGAHQDTLAMGFPRQENCLGCHFLLQGILPTLGSNLHLLHWQVGSLPLDPNDI